MKRKLLVIPAILACSGNVRATVYYADANNGNDLYSGFLASPFKTFEKCVGSLKNPGDVCELRQGVYYTASPVVTASGTSTAPIEIRGHNAEKVVIRQGTAPTWQSFWTDNVRTIWQADLDWNAVVAAQRSVGWFTERGVQLWRDHDWLPNGSAAGVPLASDNEGQYLPQVYADKYTTSTSVQNYPLRSYLGTAPANELVGSIAWINGGNRLNWYSRSIGSSAASTVDPGFQSFTVGAQASEPMNTQSAYYVIGSPYLIGNPWEWGWDARKKKVYLMTDAGDQPANRAVRIQTKSLAITLRNCSYWKIHDLTFEGVVPTIDGSTNHVEYHHLTLIQPGILQFSDKDFDYTQPAGLVMGDDSHLHHSVISGCWGRCVDVNGARDTVENNVITDHTLRGQYEGAITIQKSGALVQRNQISAGSHSAVMVQSAGSGAVVRRNLIEYPGKCVSDASGIMVGAHSGKAILDSNLIHAPGNPDLNGVLLDQASSNNDVLHNVADMTGSFITLNCDPFSGDYSSRYNRIASNTAAGNFIFATLRNIDDLTNSIIKDNIVSGFSSYGPYESYPLLHYRTDISNYYSKGLQYQGNLPSGTDPLFVDYNHQDYRLQAGSPAIDFGAIYQPGQWYLGAAPDAGAIEYGSGNWVFGPWDPAPPANPALAFEDPSLWTVSWNGPAAQLTRIPALTQGTYAMQMVPTGYVALETPPLDQSVAGGFNILQIQVYLANPPNPYWPGQVQFYIECPSLGIYNAWVGQIDLRVGSETYTLPIPTTLGDQLRGKTFNDFKIRMGVNVPAGTGFLAFDDLRLGS
jgi:hypothetical protein